MSSGETQPQSPSPQPEANSRTLRVPVGYIFVAAGVLVVLFATAYGIGFNRGEHSGRLIRVQDQQDMLERQARMNAVNEVSEPGGSLTPEAVLSSTSKDDSATVDTTWSGSSELGELPIISPTSVSIDQRDVGLNYYVIDHPSQGKVDQLLAFCLENDLEARQTTTLGGGAKVYVLPGFSAGDSRNSEIVRLLDRIREVGILWKRLAPRQNSDFSTRYAEKYKGPRSNG
jgi:hypothetical protein